MNEAPPRPDSEFLSAFLDSSLPPTEFDHRGHLRAAWLLLQSRPLPQAAAEACDGIRRLATRLGVPQKYHCTLTQALVHLMAHAGASNPTLSFDEFLSANPALLHDARGLLARHYSTAAMASDEARERFIPPDLLPLPA